MATDAVVTDGTAVVTASVLGMLMNDVCIFGSLGTLLTLVVEAFCLPLPLPFLFAFAFSAN